MPNTPTIAVDHDYFDRLHVALLACQDAPPAANAAAGSFGFLPEELRGPLDQGMRLLHDLAAQGVIVIEGGDVRIGPNAPPVPPGGVEVQIHDEMSRRLCEAGAILFAFGGMAALLAFAAILVLCFAPWIVVAPGVGLVVGIGVVIIVVLMLIALLMAIAGAVLMSMFCPGRIAISQQPGAAPQLYQITKGSGRGGGGGFAQ